MSRLQFDDEDVVAEELTLETTEEVDAKEEDEEAEAADDEEGEEDYAPNLQEGESNGVGAIGIVPLKRIGGMRRKKINLLCFEDKKTISKQ